MDSVYSMFQSLIASKPLSDQFRAWVEAERAKSLNELATRSESVNLYRAQGRVEAWDTLLRMLNPAQVEQLIKLTQERK